MFGLCRRLFILISLFAMITRSSWGGSAPATPQLDLANSRPVSAGERTPALGLLFQYTDAATGVKRTKSCGGTRVSPTQVLTAASCVSMGSTKLELTTLVAGDGRRSRASILEIRPHPDYKATEGAASAHNVAALQLQSFPSDLEYSVDVARINSRALSVGDSLTAYGAAGCRNLKENENCVLRYLKTFRANLKQLAGEKTTQKIFTIHHGTDEIAEGSLGSPLLNSQGAVVGLAVSLKVVKSDPATRNDLIYLNPNDPKILDLLNPGSKSDGRAQPAGSDFRLVANRHGFFMPVGSFPRVEVGSFLAGFDLNFNLNGASIESKSLTRMGAIYTIHQALKEGRNTLTLDVFDKALGNVFDGELLIHAGSRIIHLSLPEVKDPLKSRMRADLIVGTQIAAHGRWQAESSTLVFENVPAQPTIARVDFPDQGLSYTEFLDEKVTALTLKDGRMGPVTSHENLDFANGLSGWTVQGDPKSVRVIKGEDLKKEIRTSP